MKAKIISQNNSQRLILIYAGWAMDEKPFLKLTRPGYDIAVVWDYKDFSLDWSFLQRYKEVCLVAWSLGVFAASATFTAFEHLLTKRIAVNGTEFPVDKLRGIPPSVFIGTRENLDERNLKKFYRRVCGDKVSYSNFSEALPDRQTDELGEELDVFINGFMLSCGRSLRWDMALVSSDDAIFPAVNQWRSWRNVPMRISEGSHLPDFQKIIDRYVIDKDMMTNRFDRGFESYDSHAGVQGKVVERMSSLIDNSIESHLKKRGARILEIGSGTGMFSKRLDVIFRDAYLEMWDIAGNPPIEAPGRKFRRVDAETEIMRQPAHSFDVVVSASTVQWFNSQVRFLQECQRILAPGGYVLISSFVRGNLQNLAMSTGKTLPLLTAQEWCKIIPSGLELKYLRQYSDELEFESALEVFRHLKSTGVNSLGRDSEPLNSVHTIRRYKSDLDGRFRLCYKPIIILMQKK